MTFRRGENLPVASDQLTVGQVLHEVSNIKRRSGAVILIDAEGKLSGIFSDGDLRRLVTDNDGSALSRPINSVMTRSPKRVSENALASEAMAILRQYRIDELPVVDDQDRPVGLIDVQDLVVLRCWMSMPADSPILSDAKAHSDSSHIDRAGGSVWLVYFYSQPRFGSAIRRVTVTCFDAYVLLLKRANSFSAIWPGC